MLGLVALVVGENEWKLVVDDLKLVKRFEVGKNVSWFGLCSVFRKKLLNIWLVN